VHGVVGGLGRKRPLIGHDERTETIEHLMENGRGHETIAQQCFSSLCPGRCHLFASSHCPVDTGCCLEAIVGTFQISVDSVSSTPGGGRMALCRAHHYDASPSPTTQRPHDAVDQTPRLRAPHADRDRQTRLAVSRHLRNNDAKRPGLSESAHLALATAAGCPPPVGNALERCKAPVSTRSAALRAMALVVPLGRTRRAAEPLCACESAALPAQVRGLSQSMLPLRGPGAACAPPEAVKAAGGVSP
jgi:hypothetical protein